GVSVSNHTHECDRVGHGSCHRTRGTPLVGYVERDESIARFEPHNSLPARGQANGTTNVGAHVPGSVMSRGSGSRTRAGTTRGECWIEPVAGDSVQTRYPRGEHSPVGHSGRPGD